MSSHSEKTQKAAIRIPWWNQKTMGAGDVVAGVTKAVGVQPCGPCERRRQKLNRLVSFGGIKKPPSK